MSVLPATIISLLAISRGINRPPNHRRLLSLWTTASSISSSIAFRLPALSLKPSHLTRSRSLMTASIPLPPIPRREEDRNVLAGKLIGSRLVRQARDSTEPLIDPSRPIPDPYGWLRDDDGEDPEILNHLRAENEYSKAITDHLGPLRDTLYEELLQSIQETDHTVPRPHGEYWYYSRTYEGSSYVTYCRAPKTTPEFVGSWDGFKENPVLEGEVTYLDVNSLAEGREFCNVGRVKVSPSHQYAAYSVDYLGDEKYELHIRHLESGRDIALQMLHEDDVCDADENVSPLLEIDDFVWGKNDDTLYYVTMDKQHRPYRLYQRRHWNNDNPVDTLLKEELDDLYWCSVNKSLDGKFIFFDMASKETSEVWFIDTEEETAPSVNVKCVAPARNKVLYEVEHGHGLWFIVTNVDQSQNMKLMTSPAIENSSDKWVLMEDVNSVAIFDGGLSKALDSVTVFDSHLAFEGREGGIPRVWIHDIQSNSTKRLEFDEVAYVVELGAHYESNVKNIMVSYDSMLTPPTSLEITLDGNYDQRKVIKTKSVPGYDREVYGCDRLEVSSRDGKAKIPVSIFYKKDTLEKVNSGISVPIHLYGYGSYGACVEADFDITRLPLVKRGMIYAIAHIRGGGEMGRQWYEDPHGGKYLCKKNTFNDFVDVANFFVKERGWTSPKNLSCEGRSAGGLLIGAVMNQAPELFRCAILGVPFVDVVVTMTDSSIPLTTGEWVEWGNPNEEQFFQYMMEYSPMNNIQTDKVYPACWITGGLHDPRVAYWEPAKYVATLRHLNPTNPHPICLKLDLSVGHFSASDRYKYYRELSVDYSFLLDQLNLK